MPHSEELTTKLYTVVRDVRKVTHDYGKWWRVTSQRRSLSGDEEVEAELFQFVVVAIGNYEKPNVPLSYDIPGWYDAYPGSLIHARDFCKPESFRNLNVLVVGNGPSGWDISGLLAGVAKTVYVSTGRWRPMMSEKSFSKPTHKGVPAIASLNVSDRSVTFSDGRNYQVTKGPIDCIIICTGYIYNLAFIKKGTRHGDVKLFEGDDKVPDVYEHIFYNDDPTLAFVGLPAKVATFTVVEAQSAVVARAFAGRIQLYTKAELDRVQRDEDAKWAQVMAAGKVNAMDFHSFDLTGDNEYVNRLLAWSMCATLKTIFNNDGQPPPYWCSCLDQARQETGKIREAFKNEERRQELGLTSHRDLGGSLQGPCEKGMKMMFEQALRCRSCFVEEPDTLGSIFGAYCRSRCFAGLVCRRTSVLLADSD
ncbi:monooxygenase [Elasticomyces elasticus]|nr:monooxygenase [Elasticomyces elasticus]